ncbi:helix-turn-helix domain-containing protein [Dokdonella immobilis]|uniref:Transcriptional regulator, AlpA family n=1 Tax=Dokdonella immobilis TaxID=578942 RepID=A0A1I4XT58_9GAMM|nr:helix-turn-helix domain-containing protein [Dokdonella immobilis]SFN28479.1 transcriptional regulator, AlpA family [Dokdonella immobilis]
MQQIEPTNTPLANKVPQACARLGIGRTALYELLKAGALRSIKVGTRTLIPESELLKFIDQRMQARE